jgi:hypothetical protein
MAYAFEERDDAISHLLSPPKEVCLAVCFVCWRRFWTGIVQRGGKPTVGLSLRKLKVASSIIFNLFVWLVVDAERKVLLTKKEKSIVG